MLNLFFSGGNPSIAYVRDGRFPTRLYEGALNTKQYKEFRDKLELEFTENIEGVLLHQLYRATEQLEVADPTEKGYSAISKHYLEILKMTAPIIERMSKDKAEAQTFNGLEIVIKDTTQGKKEK